MQQIDVASSTSSSSGYNDESPDEIEDSDEASDADDETNSLQSNESLQSDEVHDDNPGDRKRRLRITTARRNSTTKSSGSEEDVDIDGTEFDEKEDEFSDRSRDSTYGSLVEVGSSSDISTGSAMKKKLAANRILRQKVKEIPMEQIESQFSELDDILTNIAGEDYILGYNLSI